MLFKKTGLLALANRKLEEIAGDPLPKLASSLAHLMSIEIVECHDLRNLFPLSVACDCMQLKCLVVSNCEMLEEIFSDKSGQEMNDHKKVEFSNLEKLYLRDLPKLTSFCKGIKEIEFPKLGTLEVDGLPNIQSLFSDVAGCALFPNTVNIHCLLTVSIGRMRNLTEIWDNKHHAGSCIKLNSLEINDYGEHTEDVDEMIIMFPALTSLQLYDLPNLKSFYYKRPSPSSTQILIQHHLFNKQEMNDHKKVEFPNLEKLDLRDLPKLTSFCKGIKEIEFPKLGTLEVDGLPNIQSLFSDVAGCALFPNTVNIHCLLTVSIGRMRNLTEIWDNKHHVGSCIKLNSLEIDDCQKLQNIITYNALTRLHKLSFLEVRSCPSLEEIVVVDQRDGEHTEDVDEMIIMFPALTSLQLYDLPNLKSFYDKKPSPSSTQILIQHHLFNKQEMNDHKKVEFPNLEKLDLRDLPKLTSFCRGIKEIEFPKLGTLKVDGLPNIQSLFSDVAGCALFPNTVNIHCLLTVSIGSMRNLTEIWDNKHHAGSCIKLNSLEIDDCQKLQNIITYNALTRLHKLSFLEVRSCPSLEEIVVVDQRDGEHTEDVDEMIIMFPALTSLQLYDLPNLKSFYDKRPSPSSTQTLIQHHLFNKQVSFPNLSKLYLDGLDSIEEIWRNQLLEGSFDNMTELYVYNCNKLRKVFPSFVATTTLQLKELEVCSCKKVEELCEKEENAEQGKSLFPQLCTLRLRYMPNLKRFCHMSHDSEWPSLCSVKMLECPRMKTFSSAFIKTPRLTHVEVANHGWWGPGRLVCVNNLNETLMDIFKQEKGKGFISVN
ncbi:hypothetical protein NMG60_11003653 [Bertholletia excelsa]